MRVILAKLRDQAFARVDIASLVFFRTAFGLLVACQVGRYFTHHAIYTTWLAPRFLFKYYGFSWVHPWPGNALYIHWFVLGVFALFVAVGFLYRLSTLLLFLSHTYFFLLDEGRFVSHTYLICLFSFLLIFVPAHRAFSVDSWLNPKIHSDSAPAWAVWVLRLQMGVVYFFAGVAKLSPDWLRGEPMRARMAQSTDLPVIGRFFREEWAVYAVSYGSMLLDLLLVPFLLWRRTRIAAFCAAVLFHLINARWFSLGIFPWLAIAATTLFLSPSWPRRFANLFRRTITPCLADGYKPVSQRKQLFVLSLLGIYAAVQLFLPLRHFLWRGGIEWVHAEHRFSWRMMLLRYQSLANFYVTDPNTGRTVQVAPERFLNPQQRAMLTYLPDMPLQFAHYLAKVMPRAGPKPLKVEARVFLSINGRKPQPLIDPNVDLAAETRPLGRPRWLLTMDEPLPPPHQDNQEIARPSDRH